MNPPPRASTELLVATRNTKKGLEMIELLQPPWEPDPALDALAIRTLEGIPDAPEVEEDGATFAANARKKASETAKALKRWALADDSGLAVDALNGRPGVHSARYAGQHGDDEANNRKLLEELQGVPAERRGAGYVCVLALADPEGTVRLEANGTCRGRITEAPRGRGGFGYDPLFLIPEYHKTFGELSALVKQQLSHRRRAFERLRPGLKRLIESETMG